MAPHTFLWHDYETFGVVPRRDRPSQFAAVRTDAELNEIGEPLMIYCQPAPDYLPSPEACLITGITPQQCLERGMPEHAFAAQIEQAFSQPGTIGVGYNTIRFDDEVTRFMFWRNLIDPYAREWQNDCGRWDLLDVVRLTYALRPDGIEWPKKADGSQSFKLEDLARANGLLHEAAHDALSDVRATIALARLIREKQPKLYDWLFQLRSKQKVMDQIRLLQPIVHISGRFSAARNYVGVVLPLAWHPRNKNALIVCDLHMDPQGLLDLSAEALRQRLYTRRDELADGELPAPLKLIHINKCPVVAPLSVLRPEDQQRLGLDMALYQARALRLSDAQSVWRDKVQAIYASEEFTPSQDPEQQLYDGFIGDRDRRLCEQVRASDPAQLAQAQWPFDDERLPELLFRYRARNFPDTLSSEEQQRWRIFCQKRLSAPEWGAPNTLETFVEAAAQLSATATSFQQEVLNDWHNYVQELRQRLSL